MDATPPKSVLTRLTSLDAYRGFVMLLMAAEVLRLSRVARALPESSFWKFLALHQTHVEWAGCSLHDLIQPSFSFIVGVALPFSIANRLAKGQSQLTLTMHAAWRSIVLIFLGVFLRSVGRTQSNFTFEDTLSQIGLGYTFLFMLGFRATRTQWIALGVVLVGYWAAFALYPLPGPEFDYVKMGVPAGWPHLANLESYAAHWNKNSNLSWAFDQWFLNLFPREKPFIANGGGYSTLSFIPTLGTMILGLIAGGWLKSERPGLTKVKMLALAGLICLTAGTLLHILGICPNVKRIWTPTWTIFSGGWCFLLLAAFYAAIDVWGFKRSAFPLVVIGMNSIAIYCMDHLTNGFIFSSLRTHLGPNAFKFLGESYESLVSGAAVLLILWLILYWMYRRKIFLRI